MFSKPEKRANWEESFNEAKQKLGEYNYIGVLVNNNTPDASIDHSL